MLFIILCIYVKALECLSIQIENNLDQAITWLHKTLKQYPAIHVYFMDLYFLVVILETIIQGKRLDFFF